MNVLRLINAIENEGSADPIQGMVGNHHSEIAQSVAQLIRDLGGDPRTVEQASVAGSAIYLLALFMRQQGLP